MNKILTTIFLLNLMMAFESIAQDNANMLIYGTSDRDGIQIQWQPLNPDHWDALNFIGYRLERVEVDTFGNEISGTQMILAGKDSTTMMLPKDTLWFEENGSELDGLITAIGALLYDTTFQFPKNDLLDANTMRYNFLLYEMQWRDLVGEALGLQWADSTVNNGKIYRYRVSAQLEDGTELSNTLDLQAGERERKRNPEGLYPKYEFPTQVPLSMMISAQDNSRKDRIVAMSRAYEDSIVIRWGPNSAEFWVDANEKGYYVVRQSLGEEGGATDTVAHVMPWRMNQLNSSIESDEMAMIAANNLHGKNVRATTGDFIQKANIFETRYSFSVFAAERSSLAADILGLRYVDYDVKPGVSYNYTISSPAANNISGKARIQVTNTFVEEAPPSGLEIIPGDKKIVLEWDKDVNTSRFSSYIVERSDDGGQSFTPLTKEPIVFMENPDRPLEIYAFQDSVGVNYVEYIYRLRGNNSFAEASAFAEVRGMAVDLTPPPQPTILSAELNEMRDSIFLKWASPPLPDDFAGYYVMLGNDVDSKYEQLTDLLPATTESWVYTGETLDGRQSHYFRIMSVDTAQNAEISLERFVAVPDLIPPDTPTNVEGYIEDDGTVHIAWEHSVADDVDGYWLYFANNPNDEFSLVDSEVLKQNSYTYKIQEKFLNEEIYYLLASKDIAGNRSPLTDVITLKRPDKVPPRKPVMAGVLPEGQELVVNWKPSVSDDVEYYLIYKKPYGSSDEWVLIDSVASDQDSLYRDSDCLVEVYYEYKVQAKDDAGWYSDFPVSTRGRIPFDPSWFVVENFTASLNKDKNQIELSWDYNPPSVKGWTSPHRFYLYKSEGSEDVKTFNLLPAEQMTFTDEGFNQGSLYNYAIKVQFENGKTGEMSAVKSVFIR